MSEERLAEGVPTFRDQRQMEPVERRVSWTSDLVAPRIQPEEMGQQDDTSCRAAARARGRISSSSAAPSVDVSSRAEHLSDDLMHRGGALVLACIQRIDGQDAGGFVVGGHRV